MSTDSSQSWYSRKYNEYYNSWVPWLEDKYLAWFGENKTSYTVKESMKTDVTGNKTIQNMQESVAEGVGSHFSKDGLLGGVGESVSKEGINRVERNEHVDAYDDFMGSGNGWTETLSGGMLGGGNAGGGGAEGKEEDKKGKGQEKIDKERN